MNIDAIGKKSALLSSIEIGLGSIIHALHLPVGGHLLSLNQGFILTRATIELKDPKASVLISSTSAILKSLSPAGKKLSPMLAIAVQGQLFALGLIVFGCGLLGNTVGMILLSFWGFIQPLLFYILIYGLSFFSMLNFYLHEISHFLSLPEISLQTIAIGLIVVKAFMGVTLVFFAHRISPTQLTHLQSLIDQQIPAAPENRGSRSSPSSPIKSAILDLFKPVFLSTFFLMLFFIYFNDSSEVKAIWFALRTIAIAFLLFLGIRVYPVEKVVKKIENKNPMLAKSLGIALRYLKNK